MTIFHYIDSYLSPTQTFVHNYIILSSKKYKQVYVIIKGAQNITKFPLPDNVTIVYAGKIGKNPLKILCNYIDSTVKKYPFRYAFLRKLLIENSNSIVHCHFGPNGIEFAKIIEGIRANNKFVVSFYGYDVGYSYSKHLNYAEPLQFLWKRCCGVFCEGPFMLRKLEKLGLPVQKEYLNPIVINTDLYPLRNIKDKTHDNGQINFLIIGRFVEKKGIHIALMAFGEMKKNGIDNFKITIVGDGEMKNVYMTIISQYNLSKHIDFKGMLPLHDCKQLLLTYDALLQPSLEAQNKDSEGGAPTVLIEAQYIGLPVIATTHADIPYVMGYDELLCKENNVADLIKAIQKFISLSSDELSIILQKGRQHILNQHSFSQNAYISNLQQIQGKEYSS